MAARVDPSPLDEVREAARACARVLEHTGGLAPDLVASIRATSEEAGSEPRETKVAVAIVGESQAARRALVNAALGEQVLAEASSRDQRVTIVRRAPSLDYTAHSRDARRVVRFSRRLPDLVAECAARLAQAERDATEARAARERAVALEGEARARASEIDGVVDDARRQVDAAESRLATARDALAAARERSTRATAIVRAAPAPPSWLARVPPWWAVWMWLLRWMVSLVWRARARERASLEDDAARTRAELAACETSASGAEERLAAVAALRAAEEARLAQERARAAELQRAVADASALRAADARAASLREEHERLTAECKAAFLLELRRLDEQNVAELVIEWPASSLPEGVTLVDVPSPLGADGRRIADEAIHREADAFVLVEGGGAAPSGATLSFARDLARDLPRLPFDARTPRVFDRIGRERTLIATARAAMRLRRCVAELSRARVAAEEAHRKRLAALESQRFPDPVDFHARQMDRMGSAIERGADDVLKSGIEDVRASVATLAAEWKGPIAAGTSRSAIDAQVRAVHQTAEARISAILEQATDHVARELQSVADSLGAWALEEIHSRYQLARRLGVEALAPVASELTREDLAGQVSILPAAGALDAFEKKRVSIGLGGAAAGAVIGTLIAPGVGTAIGAFLGVFAGFLKGVESLREECLAKIDAFLREVEGYTVGQLESKRPDLSRVLRSSLDEALDEAQKQLDDAIARLMAVERRAIEGEQAKLRALDEARDTLVEQDARLARVIDGATERWKAPR